MPTCLCIGIVKAIMMISMGRTALHATFARQSISPAVYFFQQADLLNI